VSLESHRRDRQRRRCGGVQNGPTESKRSRRDKLSTRPQPQRSHLCFSAARPVDPDLEAHKSIGSERGGDGKIDGIAAPRHQHPSDPVHIIAGVKGVSPVSEIRLEPRSEIRRAIRWWHSDITEIIGAVARQNVQALTKCDGEMGIIAASAAALAKRFSGRFRGAGMLIVQRNMIVPEVAGCVWRVAQKNKRSRLNSQSPPPAARAIKDGDWLATASRRTPMMQPQRTYKRSSLRRRSKHGFWS
jgi:hypothetical protein